MRSLYDPTTGLFTGQRISGRLIPEGPALEARDGEFDHLSQRVDLKTGEVVDYVPEAPADTALVGYVWLERRWKAVPTLEAKKQDTVEMIKLGLVELEVAQQRSLREVTLAVLMAETPSKEASDALQAVEVEAKRLRVLIAQVAACTSEAELEELSGAALRRP